MLIDLFDGSLADRPDAFAVDELTYRALHDGARRVAQRFAERGVRKGDRVAIYTENRHGFIFAYLAALRLGAIALPLNVLYRSIELAHALRDATPALVACSEANASFVLDAGAPQSAVVGMAEIEAWAADASIAPLRDGCAPEPGDVALIVYTSGTTGAAKGAMLTHANLASTATQLAAAWRWSSGDVLLLALPLFHVHGLIAGLTTALTAGARVLLRERFDADGVLDRLCAGGVTLFFGVPTMYVRLLERASDRRPPPIRLYVCGSAALSADTHRAFEARFGAPILERYGATEFGFALGNRYAGPRIPGSVGVPFPGVRVRVASLDGTQALADGEIGELLVNGPNVFAGYWHRPEATQAAFSVDADGTRWYRSGDLARRDPENGTYAIAGRIKELIISGGFNVYPREVENAIEAFAGVRACAVIGKPDAARGELPIAFVEADETLDAPAVLMELRGRLASFKIPKEIRVVPALPRNAMGKLDKPALRSLL